MPARSRASRLTAWSSSYLDYTALPFYSQDAEKDFPAAARAWKDSIADVDGVIIVTPEYSRSLPGALKNALDWAARPYFDGSFNGKPVSIMGVSGGPQATAAVQQHLRAVLGHYNAPTMGQPETFVTYNAESYVNDEIVDDATRATLQRFLQASAAHVALHYPRVRRGLAARRSATQIGPLSSPEATPICVLGAISAA